MFLSSWTGRQPVIPASPEPAANGCWTSWIWGRERAAWVALPDVGAWLPIACGW